MRQRIIPLFIIFLLVTLPFSLAQTFTYDANGNMVRGVNNVYGYDSFNNLVQVNDTSGNILEQYTYDDSGNRLTKYETATNTTTYYFDENLVRVVNTSGTYDTYYYYDDQGNLLIRKDSDGSVYYYHPDHLGSTTLVTNSTGGVVEKTEYEPYGEVLSGGNDRYTFTGKELDTSGLMYYGARYYDPSLGKFTQPDTIIGDVYNPQNLNRYSYALNNPYKYTDPTGNFVWFIPLAIGAMWAANFAMEYIVIPAMQEVPVTVANYYEPVKQGIETGDWSGLGKATRNEVLGAVGAKVGGKVLDTVLDTAKSSKVVNSIEGKNLENIKPDFYGTSNGKIVPSTTESGKLVTPHAADRMANPPQGRIPMTPNEVDNVLEKGIIKKTNPNAQTVTYWDPTAQGNPQVVISSDNARIVTVIKNK